VNSIEEARLRIQEQDRQTLALVQQIMAKYRRGDYVTEVRLRHRHLLLHLLSLNLKHRTLKQLCTLQICPVLWLHHYAAYWAPFMP